MADISSFTTLAEYELGDRYTKTAGRVFMTGTQALVRVALDQARRDRAGGLKTGGFISGYRGSPLGGVDLELWRAKNLVEQHGIKFLPAVNEDLAATAVLGSQQVETNPDKTVQGVFAMWYGKGPGVDRAGDALKHGNAYGSSPHGGVLVVAGDDHGCVSSSMPHQSDVAFMAWFMPTLNPSSIGEYLAFGEYGYALSRYSGMWVGFKAISETVESGQSVELPAPRLFNAPDYTPPATGLHYRWPDLPGPQIEERMEAKKMAVFAFAEANPIDRRIYDIPDASFGIVTTGKGHLDLMEALRLLGLDEKACRKLGIDIYKVGMVWPLARRDALEFVKEKKEILVVEEKRGIIESQLKEYFYDYPGHKPHSMVGKRDEDGNRLISWIGELSPKMLAPIVAKRLDALFPNLRLLDRAAKLVPEAERLIQVPGATRTPYFCSGCPHNSSTKVPDGSKALAGIGCHFMASWMDRETTSLIQMGGEGVNWAASSLFTKRKDHIFQNLGDGTYYHSGLDGDPAGDGQRRQHHLQDPLQRRRRDDRRAAGVDGPISPCTQIAQEGACTKGSKKHGAGQSDQPSRHSASASLPHGASRIEHREPNWTPSNVNCATPPAARCCCTSRPVRPKSAAAASAASSTTPTAACSSSTRCAKAAVTARCSPAASASNPRTRRWAASGASTRAAATRTIPA
jgi:indolepyruvate ferredoxin oxidoreductase